MPEFLTFALVAPIASFGAVAVGERRPSWERPARSAILGLVGACLGLEREDEAAQAALAGQYGVAVLHASPGRLLVDYHTAQVPPTRRDRRYATRAEELAEPELATILSRRDYRVGAWHLAALWVRVEPPDWPLARIAEAMRQPRFTPCLGRRSCPLGLPLAPSLDEAADPAAALLRRHDEGPEASFRAAMAWPGNVPHHAGATGRADGMLVARDVLDTDGHADDAGLEGRTRRVERRRDQPLSRRPWQFALRDEVVEGLPDPAEAASPGALPPDAPPGGAS